MNDLVNFGRVFYFCPDLTSLSVQPLIYVIYKAQPWTRLLHGWQRSNDKLFRPACAREPALSSVQHRAMALDKNIVKWHNHSQENDKKHKCEWPCQKWWGLFLLVYLTTLFFIYLNIYRKSSVCDMNKISYLLRRGVSTPRRLQVILRMVNLFTFVLC